MVFYYYRESRPFFFYAPSFFRWLAAHDAARQGKDHYNSGERMIDQEGKDRASRLDLVVVVLLSPSIYNYIILSYKQSIAVIANRIISH